jgi:hypothetical protein
MNGMGQIATLADRLSTMSDQMLPQLAQQYKDDAITLSLILNEKTRRERMRQSAQVNPQQAMQQPKVNDQVVASMQPQQLPEDVGIGTLPTPNIDNMAAGGLVAFADGGDVERYNSQGSVLSDPMYSIEGFESGQLLQTAMEKLNRKQPLSDVEKAVIAAAYPAGVVADVAAAPINLLRNVVRSPNDRSPKASYTPVTDAMRESLGVAPDTGYKGNAGRGSIPAAQDPRFIPPRNVTPIADDDADVSKSRTKASADNTGVSSLLKQGPATPYSEDTLAAAQQRYMAPIDEQGKQLMGRRQQLGNVQVQGETENLRSIMERQAAEGDVYKGRGERIAAREAALGKQGEENKGLAFLNAGLAIMSSRGPLGEAIGKGARVGTEQYAAGIEKIRAAQERLELAKDTLDDLRLNRSDMNRKEVKDAEASLRKARVDAEKYGLEGAEILFGVKAKNAQDMFSKVSDLYKTQYTEGEQTKRTNAQIAATKAANAPALALWNAAMQKAGGDAFKATQLMSDATADRSVMPLVKLLVEENSKRENRGQDPMTMGDLLDQMARAQSALRPVSSLPKGAEVAPRQ